MTDFTVEDFDDQPRRLNDNHGMGDRVFRGIARGSGSAVLAIMGLVGLFLGFRAWEAISKAKFHFITETAWSPDNGHFGVGALLTGTIFIGLTAIVMAVPLAVSTALYISEYSPRWLKRTLISLVDLMAAVPSIIYGLWGFFWLQPHVTGLSRWISTYLGWIPIFHVRGVDSHGATAQMTAYTSSTFIAGIVVALMVTPIACSVMREAFSQAPMGEREGAFALGATRWGMIRTVVLPFGRGGIIGGTMLGLGRALGETIAVLMIISPTYRFQPRILENGANSVSATIAGLFSAASHFGTSALMAAGLALFTLTLIINFIASSIVARSRSGASSEV